MNYKAMLEEVEQRMFIIEDISLIDIKYNEEWVILDGIMNDLYKLLKVQKKQQEGK